MYTILCGGYSGFCHQGLMMVGGYIPECFTLFTVRNLRAHCPPVSPLYSWIMRVPFDSCIMWESQPTVPRLLCICVMTTIYHEMVHMIDHSMDYITLTSYEPRVYL